MLATPWPILLSLYFAAFSSTQPVPFSDVVCEEAYAILVNSAKYLAGAIGVAQGLQSVWKKKRPIVFLIPDSWEQLPILREQLSKICVNVMGVSSIGNPYNARQQGGRFNQRRESVFMKLHAFNLTAFDKVLLIDADQVVLQDYSKIFDFDPLAVEPETCYKNKTFTSNTLLIQPNTCEYERLLRGIGLLSSYDNADMGYLNSFYSGFYKEEIKKPTSSHIIPCHYVLWRRTIHKAPLYWRQVRKEVLGVDCSGPLEEKPWGGRWFRQKPYLELYNLWWDYFDGALGIDKGNSLRHNPTEVHSVVLLISLLEKRKPKTNCCCQYVRITR